MEISRDDVSDRIAEISVDMKLSTPDLVRDIRDATGKDVDPELDDLLEPLDDGDVVKVWIHLERLDAVMVERVASVQSRT